MTGFQFYILIAVLTSLLGQGAVRHVTWGWLALAVASYVSERSTPRRSETQDASQRRVGWGYGYGAGFVDGRRNWYRPSPPPDGRTRDGAAPAACFDPACIVTGDHDVHRNAAGTTWTFTGPS